MMSETTTREFFDRKYTEQPDPWHFASSEYELARYATTMRSLAGRRYKRAFEPGCSIGVLTAQLAPLCDELFAMDISPAAITEARHRCLDFPQVKFTCGSLAETMPAGTFDLLVLSEIGYYFQQDELRQLIERLLSRVETGGIVVGVHWLGVSPDHLIPGDEVHRIMRENTQLRLEHEERHPGFRLDRWSRA